MPGALHPPEPVHVLDLFDEERAALLDVLADLTPDGWERPTVCAGWSVKDVALHVLGGDLSNISRRRDGFAGISPEPGEDLVHFLNRFNEDWVAVARRLSPRMVIELLRFTGPLLFDYFGTLDLMAMGGGVSWAGLDHAPVWLDVAREYTERWLHQQHIRDAVSRPGLADRRFLGPVLQAFAFALPVALGDAGAPHGSAVHVHISGAAGGDWSVVRGEGGRWTLFAGAADEPAARVELDQALAWRLLTRGVSEEAALPMVRIEGDNSLGRRVLGAVAIIA